MRWLNKLAELGANPAIMDQDGFNPAHIASEVSDTRILDGLLNGAREDLVNVSTPSGVKGIMGAAASGSMDNFNLLLEKGAEPWEVGPHNLNSFDIIGHIGHTELMKGVIDIWKRMHKVPETQERTSPFHEAGKSGNFDMAEIFVKHKISPNLIGNVIDRATPLHYAVVGKNEKIGEGYSNRSKIYLQLLSHM